MISLNWILRPTLRMLPPQKKTWCGWGRDVRSWSNLSRQCPTVSHIILIYPLVNEHSYILNMAIYSWFTHINNSMVIFHSFFVGLPEGSGGYFYSYSMNIHQILFYILECGRLWRGLSKDTISPLTVYQTIFNHFHVDARNNNCAKSFHSQIHIQPLIV